MTSRSARITTERPALDTTYGAITCRGVLNDLVLDEERDSAFQSFATLLVEGGLLMLEVRETESSRQRADGQPRETRVSLEDGRQLLFASRPSWRSGRIVVEERYELSGHDETVSVHEYVFEMRPWGVSEVADRLERAGFRRATFARDSADAGTDSSSRHGTARGVGTGLDRN